jgi:hypothetical protein
MSRMGDAPVGNIHFTTVYKEEEMGAREAVLFHRTGRTERERSAVERKVEGEIWQSSGRTGIVEGYGERIMNTNNLEFETRRC